ncbi:hypothetical protein PMAYCL1PPCAC_24874, partial [Pristionchus mayeri]
EGKEFHVCREYLSTISPVFRSMFEKSTGMGNSIELKAVKYQDCLEFLRWMYPSSVKNFEEGEMSRVIAMAKRFNVLFVIDQIATVLRSSGRCFLALKMILHFGFDVDVQFSATFNHLCDWRMED